MSWLNVVSHLRKLPPADLIKIGQIYSPGNSCSYQNVVDIAILPTRNWRDKQSLLRLHDVLVGLNAPNNTREVVSELTTMLGYTPTPTALQPFNIKPVAQATQVASNKPIDIKDALRYVPRDAKVYLGRCYFGSNSGPDIFEQFIEPSFDWNNLASCKELLSHLIDYDGGSLAKNDGVNAIRLHSLKLMALSTHNQPVKSTPASAVMPPSVANPSHKEPELRASPVVVPAAASSGPSPSKENEKEKEDDDQCVVCFDGPKTHLIVPCGHQCLCGECTRNLKTCPMCRVAVTMTVKVFHV